MESYALVIDDLARAAGTTSREMLALQAAASFKGIGQEDFASGMKQFSAAVYEAKIGAGDLVKLLRLNGQAVGDTAATFERVADFVRNTSDYQRQLSILQQAGLPATAEWVRLMSQGAAGIRQAKDEAVAFGGAMNDEMVRKARDFDEIWNRFWTNFGREARAAVYDVISYFDQLSSKATGVLARLPGMSLRVIGENLLKAGQGTRLTGSQVDDIYAPFSGSVGVRTNTGRETKDPRDFTQNSQDTLQRIQLLGDLATVEEKVRAKEIEIGQARITNGQITDTDAQRIRDYARAQEELNRQRERIGILGEAATDAKHYAVRLRELGVALHAGKINQDDFNRAVAYANPLFSGVASTLENNLASGWPNQMREAFGGDTVINMPINVTMPAGGKPDDGKAFAEVIGRELDARITSVLIRERRAGGMLS